MKDDDKRILKGKETKDSLIEAAIALFSKNGYDATSIKDIADMAGVPKSLFYHYFKSKDEILQHLIQSYEIQVVDKKGLSEEGVSVKQELGEAGLRVYQRVSFGKDMLKIIVLEALKNEGILDIFLDKFDLIGDDFLSIMPDALKNKVSQQELKIFQLYFRFIPEIFFTLTKDTVSEYYGISDGELSEYFLKSLLQNPFIENQEDNR